MRLPESGDPSQTIAALERMMRLYKSILESAEEGICSLDAEGRFTFVNRAAQEMLGYTQLEMIGRREHELLHHCGPNGSRLPLWECGIAGAVRDGAARRADAELFRRKDGSPLPVSYTVSPLVEGGAVSGAVLVFRKVEPARPGGGGKTGPSLAEQAPGPDPAAGEAHGASSDPLTGLTSRRHFLEALRRRVAEAHREGGRGALIVIDVDNFKEVNDTFGHRAGDAILVETAALLRSHVGESGMVARLGGDEFGVFLPGAAREEAMEVARRIVAAAGARTVAWEGMRIGVTVSAGAALFPEHAADEEVLLVRAGTALYAAIEAGRNDAAIYSPDEHEEVRQVSRFAWDAALREAIEQGRFVLECQPIADLKANIVAHYELLLRLQGEEDLILPASFLESAERSGLIRTIDRYVVRRGIEIAAQLQKEGRQVGIAVNLSGKSLGDLSLIDLVGEEIEKHRLDPSRLTFEITERMAVAGPKRSKEVISRLNKLGVRFALDDFGIGFSSFESLKTLPVQFVKIDGSFIKDIVSNAVDQRLVQSMVEMAHGTGKRVIAEYVGSARTLELLRAMGVDYAQGYYVGKPRPVGTLA